MTTQEPGETLRQDEPVSVRDAEHFETLVAEYDAVLADFYADWCGPCRMLEPVLERLARDTDAVVAKVDVDAHQALAGQYGVQGVPTLYLFADGEPLERVVGVVPEDQLRSLIEEAR